MPPRISNATFDRDIGALQATVSMLADTMKEQSALHERSMRQHQEQFSSVIKEFKEMVGDANSQIREARGEIAAMKSLIDQAKGGWKVLVGVGTISATVSAILTKIASVLWTHS